MTEGTRCTVLFLGLQRRQSLASSLLLCQATEKALEGCLLISHQAAPCLLTSGAAAGGHICHLSQNCQGALVSAAVTSTWYHGQETLKPPSPALCLALPKRKADMGLALPSLHLGRHLRPPVAQ